MNVFITLTLDGAPILVNVDYVMTVEPLNVGARVTTAVKNGAFDVEESYEKVCDLLTMATTEADLPDIP